MVLDELLAHYLHGNHFTGLDVVGMVHPPETSLTEHTIKIYHVGPDEAGALTLPLPQNGGDVGQSGK